MELQRITIMEADLTVGIPTRRHFSYLIRNALSEWYNCVDRHSVAKCAQNPELTDTIHKLPQDYASLTSSLYSVHLALWTAVFPRSQICVLSPNAHAARVSASAASAGLESNREGKGKATLAFIRSAEKCLGL